MKKIIFVLGLLLTLPMLGAAQSYTINWYKIAGGGGVSTSGTYQVKGTIGQPDASGTMTGGNYSLKGGFWSIISLVQTSGVPNLIMIPNGPNSVKLLWPAPAANTYVLQQNSDLKASGSWTPSSFTINNAGGTNSVVITPPVGNVFFRLHN